MLRMMLLMVSLLVTACAGSFTYTAPEYPKQKWNVGEVQVSIRDERPNVAATPPSVPLITAGGGSGAEVRLPRNFPEFVRFRLAQVVSGSGPRVLLEIHVERAYAEWSASAFSESEKANVKLHFRVLNSAGQVVFDGFGAGTREFSSGDASDEELAAVFRAACNDAFDQFLGNAKVISELNLKR